MKKNTCAVTILTGLLAVSCNVAYAITSGEILLHQGRNQGKMLSKIAFGNNPRNQLSTLTPGTQDEGSGDSDSAAVTGNAAPSQQVAEASPKQEESPVLADHNPGLCQETILELKKELSDLRDRLYECSQPQPRPRPQPSCESFKIGRNNVACNSATAPGYFWRVLPIKTSHYGYSGMTNSGVKPPCGPMEVGYRAMTASWAKNVPGDWWEVFTLWSPQGGSVCEGSSSIEEHCGGFAVVCERQR